MKKDIEEITKTKILTSFHTKIATALSLAGVSFLFALTLISYNSSTNSTANSNSSPTPTPTPTATPTPTPTPETGCCSFICENQWDGGPDEPAGKQVPKCVQTTEDKCACSNYEVQTACTGSLGDGYACKNPVWHAGQQCNAETGQCEDIPKKGCCSLQDQWGNGLACFEDMEEDDCDALGGKFDDQCIVCDEITNTCRDELCCQCDDAQGKFCSEVSSAQECLAKGCKPSRGNCNQKTGQCEPTGCCELPSDQCSGPVTASVCSEQGGAWNAQGTCNPETGKCEKLGCCQGAGACTQSTQDECPDNLLWIEKAECNYSTGKCEETKELKVFVDIKPDTKEYIQPRTDEDLLCYVRVENFEDWNILLAIIGTTGESFQYDANPCKNGDDPCVFALPVPDESTLAGDNVTCIITAVKNITHEARITQDSTKIQTNIYLDGANVPVESAARPYIDVVFIGDNYSDKEHAMWAQQIKAKHATVSQALPYRTYLGRYRYFRNDSAGPSGNGEDLRCNGGLVTCYIQRARELAEQGPFDRGIVVVKNDQDFDMPFASMRDKIAVVTSQSRWPNVPEGYPPEQVLLHEYGHLYGIGDQYANVGQSQGAANCRPKNWSSSETRPVPCSPWCSGANPNPVIPKDSLCFGLDTTPRQVVQNPQPGDNIDTSSECERKWHCSGITWAYGKYCQGKLFDACSQDERCVWKEACFVYRSGVCMDANADYNIGVNCSQGGCYPGCADFRPSATSLMNLRSMQLDKVSEAIVKKQIECEIFPVRTCPVSPVPDVQSELPLK